MTRWKLTTSRLVLLLLLSNMLLACSSHSWNRTHNLQPPPTHGTFAFSRLHHGYIVDIYTMDARGNDLNQLTDNLAIQQNLQLGADDTRSFWSTDPAWSPDGQWIAFYSNANQQHTPNIYIMDADGDNVQKLAEGGYRPTWSPDGQSLAFMSALDHQIVLVQSDGSNVRSLGVIGGSPDWSPDGEYIAFAGKDTDSGTLDIYAVKPDGSQLQRLTHLGEDTGEPVWSPDGQILAFRVINEQFNSDIYLMNKNGSQVRNLTNTPNESETEIAWSPNGQFLAFCRNGIHIIAVDGSVEYQITNQDILSLDWSQ